MLEHVADETEERNRLFELLRSQSRLDVRNFAREDLGTELNFVDSMPYIQRTFGYYKELLDEEILARLPISILESIFNAVNQMNDALGRVARFSVTNEEVPSISNEHKIISKNIYDKWELNYERIVPHLAFHKPQIEYDKLLSIDSEISERLETLEERAKEVVENVEREQEALIRIANSIRDDYQKKGIAEEAIHFQAEAKAHRNSAWFWLCTSSLLVVGIVLFTLLLIDDLFKLPGDMQFKDLTLAQTLQLSIPKLVIYSTLYFALLAANRSFRAHRHNYVINRHRLNALNTFDEFIDGTKDETTKNAVLLRATEAIFSSNPSGYLLNEPESQGTTKFLEFFKDVSSKPRE
jgi:hypothetical protein